MSHQMQRAFYAIQLSPTAKLIGLTLAWHHNAETGRCDPSVLLLAKETCVCERSISMALKKLEADGHITIIRRTGQHSHYLLHPRSRCGTASDAPPQQMRDTPAADAAPPPQQMRDTPAADAGKLEVTGRRTENEQESSAPDSESSIPSPVAAPAITLKAAASATEKPAKKPRKTRPIPDKPESLDQVTEYGQTLDPPLPDLESQKFMHYWKGEDWRSRRGPMKDWKHSLRTWHLNWQTYGKTDAPSRPSKPSRTVTTPDGQTYRNVRSQFANPKSSY